MNTVVHQRNPRLEIPKLTAIAQGMPCFLLFPIQVYHDPATTVWCHSNLAKHGKGKSMKAHDPFGAFGCFRCHATLDQRDEFTNEEKAHQHAEGMTRTRIFLLEKEIVTSQFVVDWPRMTTDDDYWLDCWKRKILKIDDRAARAVRHYA